MFAAVLPLAVGANVTLSFEELQRGVHRTDSSECVPGTNCFIRPICPRDGCFPDSEGSCTGDYCNAGQAYCEVDSTGRFRAYVRHLDRYCELDGLDCSTKDCEAFGEWVDGLGTSTATLTNTDTNAYDCQGDVICSTTMFSPPPPSDPPSPSQPFTYECGNHCPLDGCDRITWANTTESNGDVTIRFELGDESTVSEALSLLCASADPLNGRSACVDYLNTFDLSQECADRRSVECPKEHTSILRVAPSFVKYGRAMENVCYFHAHCATVCAAEVCAEITEGRCYSGGEGCADGVLDRVCASSECVAFLDTEDIEFGESPEDSPVETRDRRLFMGTSRRGVPGFLNARGICGGQDAARTWLIVLGILAGVAVLSIVGGIYACKKRNCCKCCCDCQPATASAAPGGKAQIGVPVATAMSP